jgi:hypothetical protein
VAPIRTISGGATGLSTPFDLALDAVGTLYVSNVGNQTVTEYTVGADGNVAPIRTITGLPGNAGLAVDAAGTLYVANPTNPSPPDSITEYAAGANGGATPIRTISGSSTGLNNPVGVAVTAATTTTAVTSSRNPSAVGQSVTYTATVSPTPLGGDVTFTDNGSGISGCSAVAVSAITGTATCTVTYSSAGGHTIVASYRSDAAFLSSSGTLTQSVGAVPVPTSGAVPPGGGGPGSPWPLALIVAGLGMLGWSRKGRRLVGR